MIVQGNTAPQTLPPPGPEPGVIDLTATVPVDTWMANPDTDLLRAHRWRGLRNLLLAAALIVGGVVGAIVLIGAIGNDREPAPVAVVTPDAAVVAPPDARPDAGVAKEDIVALSRYGFLTINANAKTSIWIDGKHVGETPLLDYPIVPGPHKVKAIGPRNKVKHLNVVIYATKYHDEGVINW